jgi:hypothetical protein
MHGTEKVHRRLSKLGAPEKDVLRRLRRARRNLRNDRRRYAVARRLAAARLTAGTDQRDEYAER